MRRIQATLLFGFLLMKTTCTVIAASLFTVAIPANGASTSTTKPIAVLDFQLQADIDYLDAMCGAVSCGNKDEQHINSVQTAYYALVQR